MTGSYSLLSLKKSHVSHYIIFITASAQNVHLQHECKCLDLMPLAVSTFNNRSTESSPLAVNESFHFIDVRVLGKFMARQTFS